MLVENSAGDVLQPARQSPRKGAARRSIAQPLILLTLCVLLTRCTARPSEAERQICVSARQARIAKSGVFSAGGLLAGLDGSSEKAREAIDKASAEFAKLHAVAIQTDNRKLKRDALRARDQWELEVSYMREQVNQDKGDPEREPEEIDMGGRRRKASLATDGALRNILEECKRWGA